MPGIEPGFSGVAIRSVAATITVWSPVRESNPTDRIKSPVDRQLSLRAVPPAGIEPATLGLKDRYATVASRRSVCSLRWQLEQSTSHLAISAKIRSLPQPRPTALLTSTTFCEESRWWKSRQAGSFSSQREHFKVSLSSRSHFLFFCFRASHCAMRRSLFFFQ